MEALGKCKTLNFTTYFCPPAVLHWCSSQHAPVLTQVSPAPFQCLLYILHLLQSPNSFSLPCTSDINSFVTFGPQGSHFKKQLRRLIHRIRFSLPRFSLLIQFLKVYKKITRLHWTRLLQKDEIKTLADVLGKSVKYPSNRIMLALDLSFYK